MSSVNEAPNTYGESTNRSVSANACARLERGGPAQQAQQRERRPVRDGDVQQSQLPELEADDLAPPRDQQVVERRLRRGVVREVDALRELDDRRQLVDARVGAVEGVDLDRQALEDGDRRSGRGAAEHGRRAMQALAVPRLIPSRAGGDPPGTSAAAGTPRSGRAGRAGAPAVADQQHVHLVGSPSRARGAASRRAPPRATPAAGQPEPRADPEHVGVHRHVRAAEREEQHAGGRLAPHAGQRAQVVARLLERGVRQPGEVVVRRAPRGSARSAPPWWRQAAGPDRVLDLVPPARRAPRPSEGSARAGGRRPRRGCGRSCSARAR